MLKRTKDPKSCKRGAEQSVRMDTDSGKLHQAKYYCKLMHWQCRKDVRYIDIHLCFTRGVPALRQLHASMQPKSATENTITSRKHKILALQVNLLSRWAQGACKGCQMNCSLRSNSSSDRNRAAHRQEIGESTESLELSYIKNSNSKTGRAAHKKKIEDGTMRVVKMWTSLTAAALPLSAAVSSCADAVLASLLCSTESVRRLCAGYPHS